MTTAATYRRLSDMTEPKRLATWRALESAPAEALADGWQLWELAEAVAAIARANYGVRLTLDERTELIKQHDERTTT